MRELCLGGAASRGICYLGALDKLRHQGMLEDVDVLAGTSIGAFICVCIAIGYTPGEMFDIILKKDTNDFSDVSVEHVLVRGSILRGEKYRTWIWDLLGAKINPMMTFAEIYEKFGKKLLMTTTSLEEGLVVLSTDNTPKMPIFYGVLATMALPFIFPPVEYNNNHYVDGGVLDNFPTRFLSKDALGITVNSKPLEVDYGSIFNYIGKLFQLISDEMRKLHGEGGNIVQISAEDFNLVDFNLTIDDKYTLYYRGYEQIDIYIDPIIETTVKNTLDELICQLVSCD